MIASIFTISICYVAGLALLLPRNEELDLALSIALALPLGTVVWTVTGFTALLTGIPVSAGTLCALSAGATVIVLALRRPSLLKLRESAGLGVGLAAMTCVGLAVPAVRITMDPALMVYMGDEIAVGARLAPHIRDWYLLSYPLVVPLLSVPNLATNPQQLPTFMPVFTASWVLLLGSRIFKEMRPLGGSVAFAALAGLGTVMLALCSHEMIFQATYLTVHVVAAALILGFFSLSTASRRGEVSHIAALAACIVGVVFVRLEGILVAVLMLGLQDCSSNDKARSRLLLAGVLAIAATLYLGGVLLVSDPIENYASLLSPKQAWVILATPWFFLLVLLAVRLGGWAKLERAVPLLTLAGLILLIAAFTAVKPFHMMMVVFNLYANMLWTGGWGFSWASVWMALLGVIFVNRNSLKVPGVSFFIGYFLFVIALGGLYRGSDGVSVPYRSPGFLNSGNRMLVHVLPLTCWAAVCCWISTIEAFTKNRRSTPALDSTADSFLAR